jgi:type IV pilus assembly protein PilO
MALLPTERHKQVALLVGFLALAGIYAVFEYWHTPRVQEVAELEARLDQIEDRNRRAQIVAARGGAELEERLAVYQRHIQRLEQLIPQSEEVPSLLNSIATEARRTRVDLGSLRPEPSVPGEFYDRQSYEMAAVGEYHDVARFLTAVSSLPRIITPLDMEVAQHTGANPRADVENPVVARFRIQTYVLPSGPAAGMLNDVQADGESVADDGEDS